uniref:RRM domain-containing protein n=1 Tax=Amphiprion ocellaris TaxID=80972 RepID=A0AAQ5YUB1_AMPOC
FITEGEKTKQDVMKCTHQLCKSFNFNVQHDSRDYKRIDGDNRSVYVGNVDYGATADEFSGHPSGFAYIEFSDRDSVHCAIGLHETLFRGRVLKVMPKRTNMPRISTTDRGGHRGGHSRGRGRGYCPPRYHNSSRGRFRFWQGFFS